MKGFPFVIASLRGAVSSTQNRIAMLIAAMLAMTAVSFAQATVVPLNVPTNEIFTSVNTWLQVFAPIVAIGVGIAIALAILTFIGKQILQAF